MHISTNARTDQRLSARDYCKRQVHCSDLFLRQLATFLSCFPRAINTHLPLVSRPASHGWFVRRTLIARLLIVQQESNVNTPITLIYSNRGRSLPIEDNLCNGAFMRAAVCMSPYARERPTKRVDYRLDKEAIVANKIDEDRSFHRQRSVIVFAYIHPRDKFRSRVERRTRGCTEEGRLCVSRVLPFLILFRKLWITTLYCNSRTCRLQRTHF